MPILPLLRERGFDAMMQAYRANLSIRSYRWKQRLWEGLSGVRFGYFLEEINRGVHDAGNMPLACSAWNTLARMHYRVCVKWQANPASIAGRPAIFYARHPGYIEPLGCLAALRDFDPKIVATAWLKRLSPQVASRIIGIADSTEATLLDIRRYRGVRKMLETIWAHLLIFNVIKHLQGDLDIDELRKQRRDALREVIATLARQQTILLFPEGGDGQKPWARNTTENFENLLRFISGGAGKIPAFSELLMVPMIARHSLRALFMSRIIHPWHPLGLFFRVLPRRPFQFTIRETLPLEKLLQKMSVSEAARFLMQRA